MKPLEGVTIVEFATMITASLAAMMAAEQGARVIKIEPATGGDPMRVMGSQKAGMSGLFANCNRGKESLALDLKSPEAQSLAQQIAAGADVVITNFRPGVMERLGLGSEALRALNPRLIFIAITGFGTEGPLAGAPAYDPVIQAHAGIANIQGGNHPALLKTLVCDKLTAYTACQALTAALFQRERTGQGEHVDLSMLDSNLFFFFPDSFMNHTLLDEDIEHRPLLADVMAPTQTADGAIVLSAATYKQRQGVHRAIGMEWIETDPRFSDTAAFQRNLGEYRALIAEGFEQMKTDEVVAALSENDVPCARCLSRDEVVADPQFAANNSMSEIVHPHLGRMRIARLPARFGGTQAPVSRPAPLHGEDSRALLAEQGLDSTAIDALIASGTVAEQV
ncbi:MAG: CoA transferase [Pseudomonadota bacterium]